MKQNKGTKGGKVKKRVTFAVPETISVSTSYMMCPLTKKYLFDPVQAKDGKIYEREAIEEYFHHARKSSSESPLVESPVTKQLISTELESSQFCRREVRSYLRHNPEIWGTDELYFPKNAQNRFVEYLQKDDIQGIEKLCKLDRRVLQRTLFPLSKQALEIICSKKCYVEEDLVFGNEPVGTGRLDTLKCVVQLVRHYKMPDFHGGIERGKRLLVMLSSSTDEEREKTEDIVKCFYEIIKIFKFERSHVLEMLWWGVEHEIVIIVQSCSVLFIKKHERGESVFECKEDKKLVERTTKTGKIELLKALFYKHTPVRLRKYFVANNIVRRVVTAGDVVSPEFFTTFLDFVVAKRAVDLKDDTHVMAETIRCDRPDLVEVVLEKEFNPILRNKNTKKTGFDLANEIGSVAMKNFIRLYKMKRLYKPILEPFETKLAENEKRNKEFAERIAQFDRRIEVSEQRKDSHWDEWQKEKAEMLKRISYVEGNLFKFKQIGQNKKWWGSNNKSPSGGPGKPQQQQQQQQPRQYQQQRSNQRSPLKPMKPFKPKAIPEPPKPIPKPTPHVEQQQQQQQQQQQPKRYHSATTKEPPLKKESSDWWKKENQYASQQSGSKWNSNRQNTNRSAPGNARNWNRPPGGNTGPTSYGNKHGGPAKQKWEGVNNNPSWQAKKKWEQPKNKWASTGATTYGNRDNKNWGGGNAPSKPYDAKKNPQGQGSGSRNSGNDNMPTQRRDSWGSGSSSKPNEVKKSTSPAPQRDFSGGWKNKPTQEKSGGDWKSLNSWKSQKNDNSNWKAPMNRGGGGGGGSYAKPWEQKKKDGDQKWGGKSWGDSNSNDKWGNSNKKWSGKWNNMRKSPERVAVLEKDGVLPKREFASDFEISKHIFIEDDLFGPVKAVFGRNVGVMTVEKYDIKPPSGFGFVYFQTLEQTKRALNIDGHVFEANGKHRNLDIYPIPYGHIPLSHTVKISGLPELFHKKALEKNGRSLRYFNKEYKVKVEPFKKVTQNIRRQFMKFQ